jgi:threonine aldolase
MEKWIDLRSDTVTQPTDAMRQAMASAPVGDDVYGEDPTMKRFEAMAADVMGKDAALFIPSGTMANQIALLAHTERGDEIILESEAHIHYYEVGGMAALAGVQSRQLKGQGGYIEPDLIAANIRPDDIHFPRTSLICLENTHNRSGGTIMTPAQMAAIREVSLRYKIPIHLDGARLFNAAAALHCEAKDFSRHVDTVMFCISKGLGAPVGSLLAGSEEFVKRCRRIRKMLGGGLRQSGILAAAGIVALETMVDRLTDDHTHAKQIAKALDQLPGIAINMANVQTNFVVADVAGTGMDAQTFINRLQDYGIKAMRFDRTLVRMVTHKDITSADVKQTIQAIEHMVRQTEMQAKKAV